MNLCAVLSTGSRLLMLSALLFAIPLFADDAFDKLVDAGNYSGAVKYADESIPAANRTADLWAKLGYAHEQTGMTEKSLACYMVALRTDAKNFNGLLGAARVYNKLNQPSNAQNYAKKAMDINAIGEASWEYARACIAQGKSAEAKKALENVVASDPGNIVANKELGTIYYTEKAFDKALPLLKLVQSKQPDADVALRIGRVYRDMGSIDEAITYLKEAAKKNAKPEAVVELARLYFKQGQYSSSAEFYADAEQAKLNADDVYQWAYSLEKTQADKDKINKLYESASQKYGSSTSKEALLSKEKVARNYLDKKRYADALTLLTSIYRVDSTARSVQDLYFLLADAEAGNGDQKKAISYLERAITKDKDNIEAYARLADLYSKSGMPDKAQSIYEKLIALQPNSPKIHKALGDYNFKSKKFEEALKNYQKSFTLDPDPSTAQGMMLAAWELGKIDFARDAAESALHYDPNLREPQVILAKIYMKEKNYANAKGMLEKLVKKEPDNSDVWKQLAICYSETNDPSKLAEADKKIMSFDRKDVTSRSRYANYAISTGDYKGARDALVELLAITPNDASVVKKLYEVSNKSNSKDEAVSYLTKYVALKPEDAQAQKDLGNILFDRKDNTGALAAYKAAVKADGSTKGIWKNYSSLVLATNAPEADVVSVLSGAVKAGEADADIFTKLGVIYQKQVLYPQAIEMYQKALQLKPSSFEVLSSLAYCQQKAGKTSDAIISYEQATAMNSSSPKEQKALGDLYFSQGKKSAGINAYKKYMEKTPTDSKTARIVADYEYGQKNYTEAVKYMRMVNGEEAKSTDFMLQYANAAFQVKDNMKASELYKALTIANPKSAEPYKVLYQISVGENNQSAAASYLKKYLVLRPEDAEMQLALGDLSYSLKDNAGALNAYKEALKVNPLAKGFYKKYVEIVMISGTDAEKVNALNGAMAANEADAKMYVLLGEIYRKTANYPRAISMLQKASQLDPRNSSLLSSLADCQAKSGMTADAVITYEQSVAMNPQATKDYKALGDLYMQQKKPDAAVKAYKNYLDKNADNTIAKLVGEYSSKAKNYTDAVKYLGMVTGVETKTASFLNLYGNASYQAKDDMKALSIYKQLAALTPQDADVFYRLSDIAKRGGSLDDALLYLKKYGALRPGDVSAQQQLGDILYERKDNAAALAAYRAVLKANPAAKGFYKKYADLVMKNGVKEEIVSALTGAISSNEADANMYVVLANIYKKDNLCAKAIPLYEKASQLDSRNTQVLSSLADCQLANGNVKEAVVTYEQAIAMNPSADKEYKALGKLYMDQKKPDAAVRSYKKYLEKVPSDFAVATLVGEQAYKQNNYAEAVKYFGMVSGEESKKPQFLMMYGKTAFALKDDPKAMRIFKELAVISPKDPVVFKTLYEACTRTGLVEEGVANLKQYAALSPGDASAQKMLGDLLYDRNDAPGALTAYRAALKTDSSLKGFYKKYVEIVIKLGTPEEKGKALTSAIAAGEGDGSMYSSLGATNKAAGNYQKAIELFEKASQLEPRNPNHLTNLAECQMKLGDSKGAAVSYEQTIAISPTAIKEYKALGDIYLAQKKTDAALNAYKKYLDKSPGDATIARIVGDNAYNAKQYDMAVKYLSMIKGSDDSEYLTEYGLSLIQVKDYKSAIPVLEKLRSTKGTGSSRSVAYKALADAYDKAGNSPKAAEVLDDYTKLPGVNDPDAAYRKAMVYENINPATAVRMYEENTVKYSKDYRNFLKLGIYYSKQPANYSKSAVILEKCIAISDTIPRVWFELGNLYGNLKRDKDMIRAFRKFIEIDPENSDACGKIGETLLAKNLVDDAMVFLEMANALKPDDAKVMGMLAKGYMRTNRPKDAAQIIEKVLRIAKGSIDADMKLVLADVYLESGKYKEASDILKDLIDTKRDNNLLLKYAKALAAQERFVEAADAIETIKATDPENIESHMVLGKIRVSQKKLDEALEVYKEVLYINQDYAPALCERGNVYLMQTKVQWAKTFFERALKSDPKYALAELGLARLAKLQKDYATYQDHLDRAKKLDPNNKDINDELRSSKR